VTLPWFRSCLNVYLIYIILIYIDIIYFYIKHNIFILYIYWYIIFNAPLIGNKSHGSAVGTSGCILDGRRTGVRVPVGQRLFTSPYRFWGPPRLLSEGYKGSFFGSKAAGEWICPLTTNYCRDQENLDLYIHFPILFHGVVLSSVQGKFYFFLPYFEMLRSVAW
jgi:hypothetical protein